LKRGALLLGIAAALALSVLVSAPVSAQTAPAITFASTCLVATPGTTVNSTVLVTSTGPTGNVKVPVYLAVVGSIPRDSNVTVSPANGTSPLEATITIRLANGTVALGNFQLGIQANIGGDYEIKLYALHVVKAGVGEQTACGSIGLPLPESTFVVTLTSVGLGLLTQVVTRSVVDLDKERKMRAEVNAFNKEKRAATLAKDKNKLEKIKKRELPMRQAQSKVQLARTKVTFITIVPLFVVYYLMATFLGGYGSIVAVSPLPIPFLVGPHGEMVLIWWYFIGSFTISSILSRVLHTNT
jgi:uncharacterized membrane protein (DUF106 family)